MSNIDDEGSPDIPTDVERNIDRSLEGTQSKRTRKRAPVYQVIGDAKIPVAKSAGKMWKSRLSWAVRVTNEVSEAWDEAFRYYANDQTSHRNPEEHASGNLSGNQRLNNNITETENVVFANITTMVPALYARNPKAEFTSTTEGNKPLATTLERLVNALGAKKAAPGLNLKPKAKRCVVTTLLSNRSWLEVGWTFKQESSEQALDDLTKLAKQLEKAKGVKQIEEIEGKIIALEDSVSILQPAGPSAKVVKTKNLFFDPDADEIDLSDAKWAIKIDFLPTSFLNAKFGKKKGGKEVKSIYEPSHVMKIGDDVTEGHEDEIFSLYDPLVKAKQFGFDDQESFDRAKMTRVAFVWDKVTRRVILYNHADWSWPIWVWDDPLRLDTFFPFFPLSFFESPDGPLTKGEVTYYLDQQDAINEMTDEERRARRWARRNVFFNSNLIEREDAELVLNGDDGTARGVNIPEGMKLQDIIGSVVPPSMQFRELFDKESKYRAIDRISSVGEVLRGAQFKTNTNKDAVRANVSAASMRIDEKSDQIEDWLGAIYWAVAQLCLQHMPVEEVVALVGEEAQEHWRNMDPDEIRETFNVQVVGGSTKKPTSAAKKEEAIELGQVLGQFANASPAVVKIMLEVMQEAFDEVVIREEDWDTILQSIEQGQQQQQGGPAQPQGPAQQPPNVAAQSPDQLQEILAQLPPDVKQQMVQAIQSGADPKQVMQEALKQISQGQPIQ